MNAIDFLKSNQQDGSETFQKEAQFLRDNWDWLKHSYAIAIKVRSRMKELGWSQVQLSKALNCTQQHISVLLGGRVNMTLETIAKLENALDFDLIGKALAIPQTMGYLSEPSSNEKITTTGTSSLVHGYGPRKKRGPKGKK